MTDEHTSPSVALSIPYANLSSSPSVLVSSSLGKVASDGLASTAASADSRTRQALADRLDVTNVAAKAAGITAPSAPAAVTCNSGAVAAKGTPMISSVAQLPLTDFHLPNVTSVIDAATNNPLPNTANKNAAARLQEQLMFGAAQRVTSGPAGGSKSESRSMSPVLMTGPGGAHSPDPADPALAKLDACPAEVTGSSPPAPGLSNGEVMSSNSIPPTTAKDAASMMQGTTLVPTSAGFVARQPQAASHYGSPPPGAVVAMAASTSPPLLQPGAVAMGAIAVLPAGPVYSGQAINAEGHPMTMNANHFPPAPPTAVVGTAGPGQSDAQHRPIFPYFVDQEAMQNGYAQSMYVGVSSTGQFIPPGMAVCAPPGHQPGAMQPMTYRAIMVPPGVMQIDSSSATPQYYYQDILSAAQQQISMTKIMQPASMLQPRAILPAVNAVSTPEPVGGRHSQTTSPTTTSPLPGILRKRNHDGTGKRGTSSIAPTALFANGSSSSDHHALNGDHGDPALHQDLHRLPARAAGVLAPPPRAPQHHVNRPGSAHAGSKSVYGGGGHPRSTLPQSPNQGMMFDASARSRPTVKSATASYPDISPRKKPRKQQVIATEDPLSSNVPTSRLFLSGAHASACPGPVKSPPVTKPQKDSIHMFPFRQRMPVIHAGGYFPKGRVAHNHFMRTSDVRVKEEKRVTIPDLAREFMQSKGRIEVLQGGRIHHLVLDIDRICSLEREKAAQYFAHSLDKKWKEDPQLQEEVEGIMDLLQGNIQRSNALIEQLTEFKQGLLKTLDHTRTVQEMLVRFGTPKPRKKVSASTPMSPQVFQ